jgi:cytosine/adenosine deaminase-related metal-dependent hydrolase
MDPSIGNSLDCDVLFEGSKILAVSKELVDAKAEVIDASEMIIAPGFIDTHRHMWQGVLRNAGSAFAAHHGDFAGLAAKFRPEDIHASSLSSALGALDAGITTVLDYGDFPSSSEHVAADIQALGEAGIRTVFAYPKISDLKGANGHLSQLQSLAQNKSEDGLHSLALASLGPDVLSIEELRQEWAEARQAGLRIFTQVGRGERKEGSLLAAQNAGLLGADVTYAHCNTLTDRELRLIRESDGAVSISSAAEMMLGYGPPTIQRFLDLGMRPGLGVDSESAARGDMFSQMRSVISMQHAMSFEKKLAHKMHSPQITTRDVFEFATIQGANALGMGERIGSLAPGKQADIVMFRQYHINVMPVNDPVGAIVWAMDTSNVDTVFVAGKIVKRGGELLGVDLPRLRTLTSEARQHVLDAVPA